MENVGIGNKSYLLSIFHETTSSINRFDAINRTSAGSNLFWTAGDSVGLIIADANITSVANKIIQFNNTSLEPYWEDKDDIELLPTSLVTTIAIKSRYNATDTSFFTGFYEAFKLMMTNKLTNEERRQWAKKSLTNLDINYPLLRSLVSPTKK